MVYVFLCFALFVIVCIVGATYIPKDEKIMLDKLEKYLTRADVSIIRDEHLPWTESRAELYCVFPSGKSNVPLSGNFTVYYVNGEYRLYIDCEYDGLEVHESPRFKKQVLRRVRRVYFDREKKANQ